MKLNHLLVPAKDKVASAQYFAEIMGLERGPVGHFAPVKINDSLVLDFADVNDVDLWKPEQGHYARQHYAFEVSDDEFDAIFDRIKDRDLRYGSAPGPRLYDMEINSSRGGDGRAVYFDELNGHSIELLTRSSIR
ncbi:MAG TPA: VOC family protein [Dehalococcoidia bacterium]|nr:VOC family protein [Dehalococcoidia bacterium]